MKLFGLVSCLTCCVLLGVAADDGVVASKLDSCMVVFGDELSDWGNFYKLTEGTFPDTETYYNGRMCDGKIWTDYMEEKYLAKPLRNYAHIGACALEEFAAYPTKNLWDQLIEYTESEEGVDPDCYHLFFFGSNEIVSFIYAKLYESVDEATWHREVEGGPANVTRALFEAAGSLYVEHGAKKFAFVVPFNLAMAPFFQYLNWEVFEDSLLFELTSYFTEEVARGLAAYAGHYNGLYDDLDIRVFGRTAQLFDWMYFSEELGFTEKDSVCVMPSEPAAAATSAGGESGAGAAAAAAAGEAAPELQVCAAPGRHLFYDFVGPTSRAHALLAAALAEWLADPGGCALCAAVGAANEHCGWCSDGGDGEPPAADTDTGFHSDGSG